MKVIQNLLIANIQNFKTLSVESFKIFQGEARNSIQEHALQSLTYCLTNFFTTMFTSAHYKRHTLDKTSCSDYLDLPALLKFSEQTVKLHTINYLIVNLRINVKIKSILWRIQNQRKYCSKM